MHVSNFGRCQGRRKRVSMTTVSNPLILGEQVTEVLKNDDKRIGG